MRRFFVENNLSIVETGVVDCPPWPDSLGFRDVRLHRMNADSTAIGWHSNIIDYILDGNYPKWMKAVYCIEAIPLPTIMKLLYSHLFYLLAKKNGGGTIA